MATEPGRVLFPSSAPRSCGRMRERGGTAPADRSADPARLLLKSPRNFHRQRGGGAALRLRSPDALKHTRTSAPLGGSHPRGETPAGSSDFRRDRKHTMLALAWWLAAPLNDVFFRGRFRVKLQTLRKYFTNVNTIQNKTLKVCVTNFKNSFKAPPPLTGCVQGMSDNFSFLP